MTESTDIRIKRVWNPGAWTTLLVCAGGRMGVRAARCEVLVV